jgi:hypothetical protein
VPNRPFDLFEPDTAGVDQLSHRPFYSPGRVLCVFVSWW